MTWPEPRRLMLYALLLAAALASTLLLIRQSDDTEGAARPALSLAYYLNDAVLTGTAEDGSVLYRIRAKRAEQNPADSSIDLQVIKMDYDPNTGPAWNVRADTGSIPAAADVIDLAGNVYAVSADAAAGRTEIRTQRLAVEPDTMRATTADRVALLFNGNQLNGTGMDADFKANTLSLLANVNGKFTP